jgi:GT2 family glycosyltransferase
LTNIKPQQHQSQPPNIKERVPYLSVLARALLWFIFAPNRRKFAKVSAAYKFGGIRLCWHRAVERFGREELDLFQNFFILVRTLWWLLFAPNRRKLAKVWATYKSDGIRRCWYCARERFGSKNLSYNPFQNQLSPSQSEYLIAWFSNNPLISIIVPVYKTECKWLDKCISSVVRQHYTNWELILVDDASEKDDLKQLMDTWASRDGRIRAYYLEENCGIADATNFGIKQAKGRFIGFLDHDDEVTSDALTWIVWTLNKHPDALWFYSDEDKISPDGQCYEPYFKPDFSPEFLLSIMYTCHFSIYSAHSLNEVGGIRQGFDGSQDHDLALRLSEIIPGEKIIHIPRVLYHWRTILGSAAMSTEEKPIAPISGRKAVEEALNRRKLKGYVTSNKLCPTFYQISLEPTKFPKVSIIIPTKNSLLLIKKCLNSIRIHTNYPNYKIIIINNTSDDSAFLEYIKTEQSENGIKVIHYDKPFNHSEMNNIAVASVDSEFVLFMNNDIEIISDRWLEQLVATIQIDESVAVAGGLLLYPDGKVQHGGIVLGLNGFAGHAHKFVHANVPGYFGRLHSFQEIYGVTAALSIVRRSAFELIGGFNSERYPTTFNDVDLCIRLRKLSFRVIYNPMVQAVHHESLTRPITEELTYRDRLANDYRELLQADPFYNPNLSLDNEQFRGFRAFPVEEQIPELANMPEQYRDRTKSG